MKFDTSDKLYRLTFKVLGQKKVQKFLYVDNSFSRRLLAPIPHMTRSPSYKRALIALELVRYELTEDKDEGIYDVEVKHIKI